MALLKSFSALRPGFQPWSRMAVKVSTYMSFCRDPLQNDRGRLPHSTLGAILPRRHPVFGDAHCSLRLCPDVSGYVAFPSVFSSSWVHPRTSPSAIRYPPRKLHFLRARYTCFFIQWRRCSVARSHCASPAVLRGSTTGIAITVVHFRRITWRESVPYDCVFGYHKVRVCYHQVGRSQLIDQKYMQHN